MMNNYRFTNTTIERFVSYLKSTDKSQNTIEKYVRDVKTFADYCRNRKIVKETAVNYKQHLIDKGYAARSINSMIASVNALFKYLGAYNFKIKSIKIQKNIFRPKDKELTKSEYIRLCKTSERRNNKRLSLILQTICSTGIRVSELKYITVEAVKNGEAVVSLKGKMRVIMIPTDLKKKLLSYATKKKINNGMIFITNSGNAISRSNIWKEMKSLCEEANVNSQKVFPHNLRHLFARIFYRIEKDIAKLADILGHSNIETTRIYIIGTGDEHRKKMERLRLVV